jgi:cobalamin biosynthetic protein CobC
MAGNKAPIAHGGDLAAATRRFGAPAEGWLDLSTGINPDPYPVPPVSTDAWARLPQGDACDALLAAAHSCYGAPENAAIVPAPGTQALIQLLARLRQPCRVTIAPTTYGEHAHAWRGAGHEVAELAGGAALSEMGGADVCIVVNPNNPDGRIHPRAELQSLRENLARRGGWLIVDEAFADVMPEISLCDIAGESSLIVLRSFGKFFGLAGLRLGFALTDKATASALQNALGPWAVSGPALEIGARALGDTSWIAATRARLDQAAGRLDALLAEHGLGIAGGTSLYRLIETPLAGALHHGLAANGILTRSFAAHPHWLRIGIPQGDEGFERLASGLRAALGDISDARRTAGNRG